MGVYDRQRATALRMIAAKGELVEWTNYAEPVVDPDKPWLGGTPVATKYDVSVLFLPASLPLLTYRKDSEVPVKSEIGYMGSVPFELSATDTLKRANGEIYRLQKPTVYDPNGEGAILYILEFKA